MRDNNEALGCPSGSVRAILALLIIPPIILGSISMMFMMFLREQYTSALGILSALTGFAGSVIGYYFGTKSAEKAGKEISKVHDKEIEMKNEQIHIMSRNLPNNIIGEIL